MNRRTQLLAIGYILILISATGIYWYLADLQSPNDEPEPIIFADVSTELAIDNSSVYEGQSYPASISITTNTTISLHNISLSMTDTYYNRSGIQVIEFDRNVTEGTTEVDLNIGPTFPGGNGSVISEFNQDYILDSYILYFNASTITQNVSDIIDVILRIQPSEVYDQASKLDWNISDGVNIDVNNGSNVTISSSTSQIVQMQTMINGSGYTRINVNSTSINGSAFFLIDGEVVLFVDDGVESNFIPIGNKIGSINLTIIANIDNGQLSLKFGIPTKRVTLFAVIADDNWDAKSGENFVFRDPSYYVEQMSYRFEEIFNISIIPAINIAIPKARTSDLFDLGDDAREAVADELGLVSGNWTIGSGTFESNVGYDILLIFTNNTMSHLGIVLGTYNSPYNMAIHARGSLYTGEYRLPPSFADNLVQHEVSHVFGAPDRFTASDDQSVMTKSYPTDAIRDLFGGSFWLDQTNWLEEDIQLMISHTMQIYW